MIHVGEGIAFGSLLLAFFGFVGGIYHNESKKRARIYQRIDEVKKKNDEDFVLKDLCDNNVKHLTDDVREIKSDVKKLLFKNGLK